MTAERLKVPAIGVMTSRFASAAESMARVLGMPGYPFAVVPHPISSADDDDLRAMAYIVAAEVGRLLLRA